MTPKRIVRWFIVNGLMAVLLWYGFGPDRIDGARYVYTFALCLSTVLIFVAACHKETTEQLRAKGRGVPTWLCVGYDVACMGFLVWHGHWGLGVLVLLHIVFLSAIYATKAEQPTGAQA